jgi:subtilisin-like proprotein convertase family protein/protocatechuate 3,4-dioxygenase beta subunit
VLTGIEVVLDIEHANVSDLEAYLIAPNGQLVYLVTNIGGSGDNFQQTVFKAHTKSTKVLRLDDGTEPFTAPFSDSSGYRAQEDLGQLVGIDPRGEWTLVVLDSGEGTAGTLKGWSLKLTEQTGSGEKTTTYVAAQASASQPTTWNEFHVVLGSDEQKELYFGNYELATVNGFKYADVNGNGMREADEQGLGGITVFVDVNDNGVRDRGEPRATTLFDDEETPFDEAGYFTIGSIRPGTYKVREEFSTRYRQTVPADDGIGSVTALTVSLQSGTTIGRSVRDIRKEPVLPPEPGLIFANQPLSEVHGRKWEDRNRNGQWDPGEPGLPGVTVYADLNHNGQLDAGEPSTVTVPDDPATLQVNESGRYWLPNLAPGTYEIREVVPSGYVQTAGGSDVLYRHPFEGPTVGPEWSQGSVQRTPYGSRGFVGTFDNDTVTVQVAGVPDNAQVKVSFDLFVLGSWSGNVGVLAGDQDRFRFSAAGSPLLDTTFSNLDGFSQSFPDGLGAGNHPARTGADEVDTLGFGTPADRVLDSVYHFEFTHVHGTGDLVLDFAASGLLNISDVLSAQWGLDNVVVTTPADFHEIEIGPGEVVGHVDFGNRRTGGEIHGEKSEDANGNGLRDPGEPGVAGVRIYIDANGNGAWDPDETSTFTVSDDPETKDIDETGRYWLTGLPAGQYVVREVVPAGSQQTFAGSRVVYQSGFESGVAGSEWSDDGVSVAPAGGRHFLGLLGKQTVTLQLGDRPAHQRVSVSAH